MKLKYIIPALAVALAATAFADTNKMIVKKTDGQTLSFDVSDINKGTLNNNALQVNGQQVADISEISDISFIDQTTLPFTIVNPKGEYVVALDQVPSMLRAVAQETGKPNEFAFGTVTAKNAAELPMGDYGIYLSLSPTAMNAGGVTDLSANDGGYTLKIYTYKDGQAVDSISSVTSGKIEYAWRATRRQLTVNIDATFSNGTVLKANYTGTPTDVTSVAEMVPEKTFNNEIVIINAAGTSSTSYPINSVTAKTRTATGSNPRTLTFTFDSPKYYDDAELQITPDLIVDKGDIDLATVEGNCYYVHVGNIQLYAVDAGRFAPLDGVMNIKKLSDNEYEIYVQVTNTYNNPWGGGTAGSGENVTIYWKGTVE